MIFYVNIKDHKNVGDRASSPFHYFGQPGDVWEDISKPIDQVIPAEGEHKVIIGGGGLLHPGLEDRIAAYCNHARCKTVLWGIGSNYHDKEPHDVTYLRAAAIGLRDIDSPFAWVPCASCMHPSFPTLRDSKPAHEIVVYEHYDYPIPFGPNPWPFMKNDVDSAMTALEHIASGGTVLTNSFHGAYWARLLGRKVICYAPFSTRFFAPFADRLATVDELTGVSLVEIMSRSLPVYPYYLERCRAQTEKFSNVVFGL